jgi:hypothetical protein
MLIDGERRSQLPYVAFGPSRDHGDQLIHKVQFFMDAHLAAGASVEELAAYASVSTRTLNRRFKAATGETPRGHLQRDPHPGGQAAAGNHHRPRRPPQSPSRLRRSDRVPTRVHPGHRSRPSAVPAEVRPVTTQSCDLTAIPATQRRAPASRRQDCEPAPLGLVASRPTAASPRTACLKSAGIAKFGGSWVTASLVRTGRTAGAMVEDTGRFLERDRVPDPSAWRGWGRGRGARGPTSPDWFQAGGGEQVGVLVAAGVDDELEDGLGDLLWGQGRTETV